MKAAALMFGMIGGVSMLMVGVSAFLWSVTVYSGNGPGVTGDPITFLQFSFFAAVVSVGGAYLVMEYPLFGGLLMLGAVAILLAVSLGANAYTLSTLPAGLGGVLGIVAEMTDHYPE